MILKQLGRTDERIAAIGLGTWGLGGFSQPDLSSDREAVEAIQHAVELGMTHIDTAEMYAAGHSEELVGLAAKKFSRDELFIATKVWPTNLSHDKVLSACEGSLRRLGLRYVDLYMIHWPSSPALIREAMGAMERLVKDGKVRYIGVSNFSVKELSLAQEALSRERLVSNQVEYGLHNREIERELLPYCEREGITVVAYSPLGRGRVVHEASAPRSERGRLLKTIAEKYEKSPAQVALNWATWKPGVVAIPKAVKREHLEQNADSVGWQLDPSDYELLSQGWR